MKEKSTETGPESRPAWESLEALARQGVQRLLQQLLEEEVEEVLGRRRYERRNGVDAPPGYRNGWGKPRRLSAMAGTITVRRPRVRGLEARFESRLLPLFKRHTEEVGRLLPELYLHGLAHGDFDLALRGLLGAAAPLSAPSIARLKAGWQAEYDRWKRRRLDDLEPVYVWADGIYVKAGLEKDKAAMLVLIVARRDGGKVVLAVESGYRESTESWAALLRDLKARGLRAPRLLIADGHLGIWGRCVSVHNCAAHAGGNHSRSSNPSPVSRRPQVPCLLDISCSSPLPHAALGDRVAVRVKSDVEDRRVAVGVLLADRQPDDPPPLRRGHLDPAVRRSLSMR